MYFARWVINQAKIYKSQIWTSKQPQTIEPLSNAQKKQKKKQKALAIAWQTMETPQKQPRILALTFVWTSASYI